MLSSVANALRVLEYVAEHGEIGVSEVARGQDLTVGTAYRLMSTLTALGFLEKTAENRRYRPGPKIPDLARLMLRGEDFLARAHPYLENLMVRCGETTNLGILRDGNVVYIDRAVTAQPLAVAVSVGSRVPAYCTALGRGMLAFSPRDVVSEYVSNLRMHAQGHPQPPPSRSEFMKMLEDVRRKGIAEDDADFSPHIACIGAPIVDSHGVAAAAISVSGPVTRILEPKDELAKLVQETANELSELLQMMGDRIGR